MPVAAYFLWFGVAWVFILAVLFKRWRERERRDQAATDEMLERTKPAADDSHAWDAF